MSMAGGRAAGATQSAECWCASSDAESFGGAADADRSLARTRVAWRTEKESLPENTRCRVVPSALIHFDGKLAESPGPTSQSSASKASAHGPHGCGAS